MIPEIEAVPNHGQWDGVGEDRHIAVNRETGEVLDDDTGEIITTVVTTTTTTTRRRANGERSRANSSQSQVSTLGDHPNHVDPGAGAYGDPRVGRPQQQCNVPQPDHLAPYPGPTTHERPSLSQQKTEPSGLTVNGNEASRHRAQSYNGRTQSRTSSPHAPPLNAASSEDLPRRGRHEPVGRWEALEELKRYGKDAAPEWRSTLKNLEGVAVGLHVGRKHHCQFGTWGWLS